jgi:hypothetical protein
MLAFPNRTRRSPSIPRRLLRDGKAYLLPVYGLMLTSDLAREGIHNSGSFRFADHVYRGEPSGRFGVGYLLDAALLRMAAARSMRSRFTHSRDQVVREVTRLREMGVRETINVLSVPCGIARELVEAARLLERDETKGVRFFGIDLDDEPLALSRALSAGSAAFTFARGDAFDLASYPRPAHVIVSTGLVDFLDDGETLRFFATALEALTPGGLFVTSAQQPQRLADYLMRELAELRPFYRSGNELTALARRAGFTAVNAEPDVVGYQALLTARRVNA